MDRGQYDNARRLVESLEHRFRDKVDNRSHPLSRNFEQGLRGLQDKLQTYANPRSIEADTERLKQAFRNLDDHTVMDHSDSDHFSDELEKLKMILRKFENY